MNRLAPSFVVLAVALVLTACAATDTSRVTDAAVTPLNDLHLVHAPIPPVLSEAQQQPYRLAVDATCVTIGLEVRSLDAALGPDLDAPETPSNPSLIERGGNAAGDAAVGALRRTAEGVVPFRGWVRKLSGAERYSRKVAAAIAAGTVRRAFLKGVSTARACAATA